MTETVIEAGHLKCPNCAAPMNRHRFGSNDSLPLEVDACYACHAIWFDSHESARLSPDGVVELFRFIHAKGGAATARLSASLGCARCRAPLASANDIARNNRFSYHRCPQGHGRLTTFLHFLREKQFVRDLTLAERQTLAAHVRQIKCSSCSGPIDIAHQSACGYCGAAVSVLDKDATQKALDHYLKERQRQPVPAHSAAPAAGSGSDLGYLMFDVGTDVVGVFARMAARPSAAAADASALPSLNDALAQSGLENSLSFIDPAAAGGELGNVLTGDMASVLTESSDTLVAGAAEAAGDGGLVDLVSDGIGAIVEGIFS